jgi:hypothetical protein
MKKLDVSEQETVKKNLDNLRIIFETNAKVLNVNSNKNINFATGQPIDPQGMSGKKPGLGQAPDKLRKYKIVPCRMYHSEAGCGRGEACHYIHHAEFKGKPVPHMEKYVDLLL